MKSTEQFKNIIKAYLDKRASEDELFAMVYAKENKTLDECIQYIFTEVKASGCNGFADEEIFGMAVHYYDEDNLTIDKNINAEVVVNEPVKLSEEEKQRLREEAMQEFKEQQLDNLKKQFRKVDSEQLKKNKAKEDEQELPSLF